jgi:hypothetical protein
MVDKSTNVLETIKRYAKNCYSLMSVLSWFGIYMFLILGAFASIILLLKFVPTIGVLLLNIIVIFFKPIFIFILFLMYVFLLLILFYLLFKFLIIPRIKRKQEEREKQRMMYEKYLMDKLKRKKKNAKSK